MVKNIHKNFLLVGCVTLLAGQAAWAKVGVEVFGTGGYSMATGTPAPTSAIGFPGGGLGFNFHLSQKVDLELAGQYLTRAFTTPTRTVGQTMAQINLGFKFHLGKAVFLNLGGYFNDYFSNTLGVTPLEYGAYAGLGLKIPMGSSMAFFINPRYNYALVTQTYTGGTYTPSEILGIAGFVFGGGAK